MSEYTPKELFQSILEYAAIDSDELNIAHKALSLIHSTARIGLSNRSHEAEALDAIHALVDGQEWSPDTLDAIAEALREAGYTISEPS